MPDINADHVRRLKLQIAVRVCLQRRWKWATIRSTHIFVREGREDRPGKLLDGHVPLGALLAVRLRAAIDLAHHQGFPDPDSTAT